MLDTVIVFGATGFIGRNLVKRLSGKLRIIAVSRSGRVVDGADICLGMKNLSQIGSLSDNAMVFNLAAQPYDASRFDIAQSDILTQNVTLTQQIYQFCAERQIKEVRAASSVAVYEAGLQVMDDAVQISLTKDPNPNEVFYGWSKRWGEIIARLYADKFGISTLTFRLSNPYGPHDSIDIDKAHVLPAFVMRALGSEPTFRIRGSSATERDFVYVGDVCDIFEESMSWSGVTDAYNLCTGKTVTLLHLAESLLEMMSDDRPIETEQAIVQSVAVRRSTNERLMAAFDKEVFSTLREGLKPTLEWYHAALGK